MKNVAIIAEYNPLHLGHLYQMSQIDKDSNIIVALSGNFTERGDVALVNKYTRARLAVEHGASMVVEIPTLGVLSCAEHYAKCALRVLSLLGNIDEISFGSECGDIDILTKIANLEESTIVKDNIKKLLNSGISYPKALSTALSNCSTIPDIDKILSTPNNILGIEYIRACNDTNITPTTIKRCGNNYNDGGLAIGKYASATSIREHLNSPDVAEYLPSDVLEVCRANSIDNDIIYHNLYQRLVVNDDDISSILGIVEGIDNRIKSALLSANSYASLLVAIKTKRYTLSRIKRTLLSILLNIGKDMPDEIDSLDYVTVLAIKRDKLGLLSSTNANIVTKYNDYNKTSHPFAKLDIKANKLYNLLSTDKVSDHRMVIVD